MVSLIKRDNNELRYNSILLLQKEGNPNYWKNLFRNAKAFFYGMNREDLIEELDKQISIEVEKKIGLEINYVLYIYKNLMFLNSFTKSRVAGKDTEYIYKYTIEQWLDKVETWVFKTIISLEPLVRFTMPPKQFV